jgi:hypothetical protein
MRLWDSSEFSLSNESTTFVCLIILYSESRFFLLDSQSSYSYSRSILVSHRKWLDENLFILTSWRSGIYEGRYECHLRRACFSIPEPDEVDIEQIMCKSSQRWLCNDNKKRSKQILQYYDFFDSKTAAKFSLSPRTWRICFTLTTLPNHFSLCVCSHRLFIPFSVCVVEETSSKYTN